MSLFFAQRMAEPEARAVTSIAGWGRGEDFSPASGMKSTLALIPVFAAVRAISDPLATMPLHQYRGDGEARSQMPLAEVFANTQTRPRRIQWIQQALMSLLIRGNAYGYVVDRTGGGLPGRVRWLNPEHVDVDESGPRPVYRYQGAEIPNELMRHIAAYPLPGTVVGLSPIGACQMLGEAGAAAQSMLTDWFKNRALPGSTFQNVDMAILPDNAEVVSDRLNARMRNGKPLVFGKDWKFDPVTLSASDAAFIDAAKLSATQVASIYGVPPEKVGGETGSSLTYSTVELNTIDFLQSSLQPWMVRLEDEFSSWLPQPQYVKFNADASIRVATRDRYEVHRIAREIGLNNIDELRALEDEPPLPNGQGQDYTPLKATPTAAPKETR